MNLSTTSPRCLTAPLTPRETDEDLLQTESSQAVPSHAARSPNAPQEPRSNLPSLMPAPSVEQRLRQQNADKAVPLCPPSVISIDEFPLIQKKDLRRGHILLTYEAQPTSENHGRIQHSQRAPDLNAIKNNCGSPEIVHAGIILRDDVLAAEANPESLGPQDHPYLSERGGVGTTNALRALGTAVPNGEFFVYQARDEQIRKNMAADAKAKLGVPYSHMELGTSLKDSSFQLPEGIAERNTVSHIVNAFRNKTETTWANEITVDEFSDESERRYAARDAIAVAEQKFKTGPGASCSTFLVKNMQAAVGAICIAKAGSDGGSTASLRTQSIEEKARAVYHSQFPVNLRIDAKRISPKSLQHLFETVLDNDGQKIFERVGRLKISEMAYAERRFDPVTREEKFDNTAVTES